MENNMWRKQFCLDIQNIFGFKNVIFGNTPNLPQQNCAWINNENVNSSFPGGTKKTFFITGTMSVGDPKDTIPDGRLSEKYQVSKKCCNFRMMSGERPSFPLEDSQIKIISFDFMYTYSVDFNPKKSWLEIALNWFIN